MNNILLTVSFETVSYLPVSFILPWIQISSQQVDFQGMSVEELKLREDMKLYPPRFVITAINFSTAEDSVVGFTFEGATEKIVRHISLTKGIIYM